MKMVEGKYSFRVCWLPFLLRPGIPEEGIPKDPNPQARVGARLKQAGQAVGIDFTGKCDRYPNTVATHALLEYAREVDNGAKQNELAEVLFQAYFTDGIYLDTKNLVSLGEKVGFDKAEVEKVVTDPTRLNAAKEAAQNWSRKGVSGVPMFYMNGQKVVSGAQDPHILLKYFEIAAERYPID